MAVDKTISQLPDIGGVQDGADVFPIDTGVGSFANTVKVSMTQLTSYLSGVLTLGSVVTFGTSVPSNGSGNDGDAFIKTDSGGIYSKISGVWTLEYTIASNAADGTLIYNSGVPADGLGKDTDSCIDTLTGIFYLKTAGAWAQVFSMASGPAGIQGAGYSATSSSSLAIATGSKSFTTQIGLAYVVGQRIRASYDTSNFMEGVITSYSGSTLVMTVDRILGSGTYATWTIGIAGDVGDNGTSGLQYQFNTSTANTDPTDGKLKFNNATLASATKLYISKTDNDTNLLGAYLAYWTTGTSTVKGTFTIQDPITPTNFCVFNITGTVTDNGDWDTFDITYLIGGGTFTNNLDINVSYFATGDLGETGAGYLATSSTLLSISIASKTFATQADLAYTVGARVRLSSDATPTKWMEGVITAYDTISSMTVNIDLIGDGSGESLSDWNINIAGEQPNSGTWWPTLTNGANTESLVSGVCRYYRIGNLVHCSGIVSYTATTINNNTYFFMTLPITPEEFTNGTSLAGVGVSDNATAMDFYQVRSENPGIRALVQNRHADNNGSANVVSFEFTYRVENES